MAFEVTDTWRSYLVSCLSLVDQAAPRLEVENSRTSHLRKAVVGVHMDLLATSEIVAVLQESVKSASTDHFSCIKLSRESWNVGRNL